MKICLVRKIPYRLPRSKNRVVWSIVLAEREGLALLFVPKPDENQSHFLAIAAENVKERVFEDVNATRFPLEQDDLFSIAAKLQGLAEGLSENELRKLFEPEDLF